MFFLDIFSKHKHMYRSTPNINNLNKKQKTETIKQIS